MGNINIFLAPNGKLSNLTADQWYIVRTPEFKQWFGNWDALAFAKINDSGMDEVTLENLSKDVSKVVDENEEPLVLWHGTSKKINKFNKRYSAQGVFWFTSDKDKINRGESGASSTKVLIEAFVNAKKLAGWSEYNKLGLGEIKSRGFDGIKLDENYVIFESNQIKLADGSNKTFDIMNTDIRYEDGGNIDLLEPKSMDTIQDTNRGIADFMGVGETKTFPEDELEVIQEEDTSEGGGSGSESDNGGKGKEAKDKGKKKGKNSDKEGQQEGGDGDAEGDEEQEGNKEGKDKKDKKGGKGKEPKGEQIIDLPYPPPEEDEQTPPQQSINEPQQPISGNIAAPDIDAVQAVLNDLNNLSNVKYYLLPYMSSLLENQLADNSESIANRCEAILWNRYATNILMTQKRMSLDEADSLKEFNEYFFRHYKYVTESTIFRNGFNYINFDVELKMIPKSDGLTLNAIKSVLQSYVNGGSEDFNLVNTYMLYVKSVIVYFDKVKKYDDNYFRIITLTAFLNTEYLSKNYLQVHLEFMKSVLGISSLAFKCNDSVESSVTRNIIITRDNTYVYRIVKQNKGLGHTTIDKNNIKSIGFVDETMILYPIFSFYKKATDMLDIGNKKKYIESNEKLFNLQNESYNSFLQTLQITLIKQNIYNGV